MTDFFKITEQSRPGTSTERDEENYSVQEKEDYDDQHQSDCEFPENVSCDLPANTQPSISKITESQFTPIPDDPCKWPESISDAQRCDIVKRGPHQLIMNFPYNNTTPRRRFSSNHYKRVLPNGRVTISGKAKIGTMDDHFARDQIYGPYINFFNKIGTFKFSSRPDL